jgi:hypothetical protein
MSGHVFRLFVPSMMAVTMAAQTPSPTAQQPGVMLTVEGCLTREPAAGISAAATQFVLVDRRATDTAPMATTPVSAQVTSPGATAAGNPPPARKMYVLRAQGTEINLDAHVNQVVRVTGASTGPQTTSPLAGRSPEATPNPGVSSVPGSTGTMFDTANLPTLAVTTLTVVAERCR